MFGEYIDYEEVVEVGLISRLVKMWKIFWGLGGMLLIFDFEEVKGY